MQDSDRFRKCTLSALAAGLALTLLAFAMTPAPATAQEGADSADTLPTYVLPPSGPFSPERVEIPNMRAISAWIRSGHSDASSEAFSHWNDDGEIPARCATCHAGAGFRDFHGLDGTAPGSIDGTIPAGGVVDCATCHDPGLGAVTQITLPSGVEHPVTSAEAACVTCHQGRAAGQTITDAIADKPLDTPDAELGAITPHYAIAAASSLGSYGGLGFHYPDKSYSGRFLHAKPVDSCLSCHNPHSLEVAQDTCLTCHQTGLPADIRISRVSYDGSGDLAKGISADIEANSRLLMDTILDYASQVAGLAAVYDAHSRPYFFADANGDGLADQKEGRPVVYPNWTPRMVQAVYNYKVVTSDKAIFVHNPHYALELLHDSIEDLLTAMGRDVTQTGIQR